MLNHFSTVMAGLVAGMTVEGCLGAEADKNNLLRRKRDAVLLP